MGQKAPEGDLCQALLDFVIDGKYPESEDVVASDFPSSAVSNELEQISKAREQAEVRKNVHCVWSAANLIRIPKRQKYVP